MKHIGIVAVSAAGAALCYRTICLEGAAILGPHEHPEIIFLARAAFCEATSGEKENYLI